MFANFPIDVTLKIAHLFYEMVYSQSNSCIEWCMDEMDFLASGPFIGFSVLSQSIFKVQQKMSEILVMTFDVNDLYI